MNEKIERLAAFVQEQRELNKALEIENQQLRTINQALNNRIKDLEQQHIVIDREIAEIPTGFDLVPESDLNRY